VTLRGKLLLSQTPLLVGLAALGVIGSLSIGRLGRSADRILAENYRSVLACQRMKESIERIDSAAMFMVAGHRELATKQATDNRVLFEQELVVQQGNITEPGEGDATQRLTDAWTTYQGDFDAFTALTDPTALDQRYFAVLQPDFRTVKDDADEILAINEDAMVAKGDHATRVGHNLDTLIFALTIGMVGAGLVASVLFTNRILRPLGVLSQSVRRLGEGDVKARAQIKGTDEIAVLANDFNQMANRLEQYRSSSLGDLLLAQQAAEATIDSLPDPVIILGLNGEVRAANRAAEAITRVSVQTGLERAEPGLRQALERIRHHVTSGRGAYVPKLLEEAIRVPLPDGDRHFLPRAASLHGESRAIEAATIVLEDITRVLRFDELKTDLVATVAHEFRTPLTSLRMAVHLMAEETVGPLTEKQADLLHAAREDCDRLQTIVDDILDLSRIQAGRLDLNLRPAAVEPLVAAAVGGLKSVAAERGVTVTTDVRTELPQVLADPERLQLVFANLVGNAIRHSPNGGRVEVHAHPVDHAVRVEVKDTGEGIPREYHEAIFDKFFRVPSSRSHGAGLGLYISREIVRAHGGAIGVESEPGRGSTFWFTLPSATGATPAVTTPGVDHA
jgi:signal transduction histidine kinase